MAADKRKQRLNTAGVVGYNSLEQHKVKRRKLVPLQYDSSNRSNISLEWDDKRKSVVAKREQIGLSKRDLIPFIDAVPNCHNVLADVVAVPQEIFGLENLTEVLSFEVWQTHLSENERNLLTQFLPEGVDARNAVQDLLAGNNFHFGNPLLKWVASLCSGNLHPDAVLHKERILKANKKAYYLELQKYHHDMIGNLQMWKERLASCKEPEKEIVLTVWRSRKNAEKTLSTHEDETILYFDDNIAATSESFSWAADEKTCSSDDLNFMSLHEDSQRGICRNDFMESKYNHSLDGPRVVARSRKGEKLHKPNVQCNDGAKYMSYIKVSKEQHRRVKSSMKHSNGSIQPKSLNHVLGNLDAFCVQPYKVFEEEERQKLHEHWLQLASRDLPAGFANWRRRQLVNWKMTQALGQELEEKSKYLKEDEAKESPNNMLGDRMGDGASDHEPTIKVEDAEKERSDSLLPEKMDNSATNHETATGLEGGENKGHGFIFQQQRDNNEAANNKPVMEDEKESVLTSTQNQHLRQISILGENRENLNHLDAPLSRGNRLSSAGDVWPAVSMPRDYYHSILGHNYVAPNEFLVRHPQVMEDHPARLINLQSDTRKDDPWKEDPRKYLLSRQSGESFYSHYPNQVRNELFQPSMKAQGSLPYHNEQKLTGLDFHPPADVMIENVQLVGHLRDQLHTSAPMDFRQKRMLDGYMHQNIQESMYFGGVRYSIPRQEHFSTLNMPNWTASGVHMSGHRQYHLNEGQLLGQNMFSGDNQARVGWSGSEGALCSNPLSIGNGTNADQTLFSVLSQCNELRSGAPSPYSSTGSCSERFKQSGSSNLAATSNVFQQTANPLNYLSGHEIADGMKSNNIGWMSLPLSHENTAFHDSIGKPYLRNGLSFL